MQCKGQTYKTAEIILLCHKVLTFTMDLRLSFYIFT